MPPASSTSSREVNSPAELFDALGSADRVVLASPELIRQAENLLGPQGHDRTVEQDKVFSAFSITLPQQEAPPDDAPERTVRWRPSGSDELGSAAPSSDEDPKQAEEMLRKLREAYGVSDATVASPAAPSSADLSKAGLEDLRAGATPSPRRPTWRWLLPLAMATLLAVAGVAVWLQSPSSTPPASSTAEAPHATQPSAPKNEVPFPPLPPSPHPAPPQPSAPAFDPAVFIWPVVVLVGMILAFLLVRHALSGEEEVTFSAQWKVHKLVDGRIELVRGKASGRAKRRRRAVAT